jgi:hypothetical protein
MHTLFLASLERSWPQIAGDALLQHALEYLPAYLSILRIYNNDTIFFADHAHADVA